MKIFKIILCFFFGLNAFSQSEFAPIGAKWYFDDQEELSFQARGYTLYEVFGDTLINTQLSKLIKVTNVDYKGNISDMGFEIIYSDNSEVYYWNDTIFNLMYDFSLQPGDTLKLTMDNGICDSISPLIVDSVTFVDIDEIGLKEIYISSTFYYSEEWGSSPGVYTAKLIEKAGNERYFIYQPKCAIGDYFVNTDLRCYMDDEFIYRGYYWDYFHHDLSCDTIVNTSGINEYKLENKFLLYPNPAKNFLFITSFDLEIKSIEIYNVLLSRKIYSTQYNDKGIDISQLPEGIYFVQINTTNNYSVLKKIVKH